MKIKDTMEKSLKVNYLFYKDFSKYLRKESLKHMDGISYVTRVIRDKIATANLTKQDIQILINFNDDSITKTVFKNPNIPIALKYKYYFKHALYNRGSEDTLFTQLATIKNTKIKLFTIKRINKLFESQKLKEIESLPSMLNKLLKSLPPDKREEMTQYSCVKYSAVLRMLTRESSWYDDFDFTTVLPTLTNKSLINITNQILLRDITVWNCCHYTKLLVSTLVHLDASLNDDKSHLNCLLQSLEFSIKEIFSKLPIAEGANCEMLGGMVNLVNQKKISENFFIEILKSTPLNGSDTLVGYLISLIQKGGRINGDSTNKEVS